MAPEQNETTPTPNLPDRAQAAWERLVHGSRLAGRLTGRSLMLVLKIILALYFVLGLAFLGLRYAVLPNIGMHKERIEQAATRALGQPVAIGAIDASWRGMMPHLSLSDVVLRDREGRPALQLPAVAATLSWWSLAVAELRFHSLEITRPELNIRRSADGKLYLAGIPVDSGPGRGGGLEWLLSQREILIRDGRLRWSDELRQAPELVLEDVDLLLHNQWRRHRLGLKARPPQEMAAPLDVRADFVHPAFAGRTDDWMQWRGQIFADLQQADLAAFKPYFSYPIDLQQGKGSVRAWLSFDHARVADITADLALADVMTRLRQDLPALDLAQAQGRISAREILQPGSPLQARGLGSFGEHGHAVSLQDFSMQTRNGQALPRTSITEKYVPAGKKQAEQGELTATVLELQTLAAFAGYLPLPPAQRRMLDEYAPRGRLQDVSVQWQGEYPQLSSYAVRGKFAGLSLQAPPAQRKGDRGASAGFSNLTGELEATHRGGWVDLASDQLVLNLPAWLDQGELPFERLKLHANWNLQEKDKLQVRIERMEVAVDGFAGSFSGRHTLPWPQAAGAGIQLGTIDLGGKIAKLELNKVGRYLPRKTPEALRAWLSGALVAGQAQDAVLALKGDLTHFPFHTDKPGEKPAGVFTVAGKLAHGGLNYAPSLKGKDGKSPFWPLLEEVKGSFIFDRTRMEIRGETAKTMGVDLSNVTARVADLIGKDPLLEIDGTANGALQDMVRYVNASPVDKWIDQFTEHTKASGSARLGLKLQLPLHHMPDAKVQGVVQLAGNDINLLRGLPTLQQASGKLEFTETGLNLNAVRAQFLGGPVAVAGGVQRDSGIQIKAAGSLSADGLRKAYPAPGLQGITARVGGATRYTVNIGSRNRQPEITVESNLQGLSLDFPAPLRKGAAEVVPTRFQMTAAPQSAGMLRDEIRIAVGALLSARYQRQKPFAPDGDSSWQVVRGGIAVNAPLPEPETGLVANIELKTLDLDAWRALAGGAGSTGEGSKVDESGEMAVLAPYLEADAMAARASELVIMGKTLDKVVMGASHSKNVWQANIDSTQAAGHLTWVDSGAGNALGQVTARFSTLVIPKSGASSVTDVLSGKDSSTRIPSLDVKADQFELMGLRLGRLELAASNVGQASGREWRIDRLWIANSDAELKASGRWRPQGGPGRPESVSSLVYLLDIGDAGRLLERLGFPRLVKGGEGSMQGELHWNGLPFSLDIPSLSGNIRLDMEAGQFLKVDAAGAGASKLLGVLSLQALPRRLTLDFRDVFSAGFAFDGIAATATIDKGVLKTDNLKMRGVSATVLMDGSADLVKETQNLHVVVLPEINMGAASVVYGLAVNPVIGVGTFLAQLFLRDPLMRAFTFEYNITGPWKDPIVAKRAQNARAGEAEAQNP